MLKLITSFSVYLLVLSLALWVIGFGIFCLYTFSLKYVTPQKADAIVVLTGGDSRIETAIRLLQDEAADYLLISGVNQKVSIQDILPRLGTPIRDKITLGYKAKDTIGNAQETADWIQEKQIQSVLLVTSFYHMPRSIVEVLEKMPDLKITPYPVFPKTFDSSVHWIHTRHAWLLFVEYHKFIIAYLKNKMERMLL